MMQISKLRHAFNQCYAFLPLPRWSFLSHMETAIKTWIQSLYVPSNKTKYEITLRESRNPGALGMRQHFNIQTGTGQIRNTIARKKYEMAAKINFRIKKKILKIKSDV